MVSPTPALLAASRESGTAHAPPCTTTTGPAILTATCLKIGWFLTWNVGQLQLANMFLTMYE